MRGALPDSHGHAFSVRLVTLDRAPAFQRDLEHLNDATWPEFLMHGDVRAWSSLYTVFRAFQLVVLDADGIIGAGLTVPFAWAPDESTPQTIDEVVSSAQWPLEGVGVLCALAVLVTPEHRRRGMSREILRGSVEDWESWTGQSFGDSGRYAVDGGLVPVRIDLDRNRGEYEEPNVWYFHPAEELGGSPGSTGR